MTDASLFSCGLDLGCLFSILLTSITSLILSNMPDIIKSSVLFLFELLMYIPIIMLNNLYSIVSSLYSVLYGIISFIQGMYSIILLLRSGFWPEALSTVITYLFFLSIGLANSRLILNAIIRIYRLIPIIGGR